MKSVMRPKDQSNPNGMPTQRKRLPMPSRTRMNPATARSKARRADGKVVPTPTYT